LGFHVVLKQNERFAKRQVHNGCEKIANHGDSATEFSIVSPRCNRQPQTVVFVNGIRPPLF
jgi:hypothetical protein